MVAIAGAGPRLGAMTRQFAAILAFSFFMGGLCPTSAAWADSSVYLEDLTSPEVKTLISKGYTTVLIPSGGTEQNGPHIALGKHNWIVAYTSGAIARKLGNALVAPVIAYVPEGRINPPDGHMLFAGTASVREETFEALLEDAARSYKQAGFKLICLLGDHGGNQQGEKAVAGKLSDEWKGDGVTVLFVSDYYEEPGAEEWAKPYKKGPAAASDHAGFMDTSEALAIHPQGVRKDKIRAFDKSETMRTGVAGDPRGATAEYGKKLLQFKVDAAVKQIQQQAKR